MKCRTTDMLHRWGYGEFSAHFLVGAEGLLLDTYQRFRQFDRGYLLMLVGRAQSSGESGVRASRCGYGGVIGGELPRSDRSHAAVDGEGVGGTVGTGGKIEASIAGGFGHGGERYRLGVVAAGARGDRLGWRGLVTGFGHRERERPRMGDLQTERAVGAGDRRGGRSRNDRTGQTDARSGCILYGAGYRGGVGWSGSAATGRGASGQQQCRRGQCARRPRE